MFTQYVDGNLEWLKRSSFFEELSKGFSDEAKLLLIHTVSVFNVWFAEEPKINLPCDTCISLSHKPDYTFCQC